MASNYTRWAIRKWKSRRQQWVDPLKDKQSKVIAVANEPKCHQETALEANSGIKGVLNKADYAN